jgi:DNA-binding response OmpR family regulator
MTDAKTKALKKLLVHGGLDKQINEINWKDDLVILTDMAGQDHCVDLPVGLSDLPQLSDSMITVQTARFDPAKRQWHSPAGKIIQLTEMEVKALSYLAEQFPTPISGDQLLQHVWGYGTGVETHTIETHIYRIRQKIEENPTEPAYLLTAGDGQGYYLALTDSGESAAEAG